MLPHFAYMRWAKGQHGRHLFPLHTSGMAAAALEDIPGWQDDFSLHTAVEEGDPRLVAAIAAHHGVTEAEVFVAPGTSGANYYLLAALLERGDRVLVEHPRYEVLGQLPEIFGARVEDVPRPAGNGYRIDVEALVPRLRGARALVVSDPHNPSGALLGNDTLAALADACTAAGTVFLVDEVYRDYPRVSAPDTWSGLLSARQLGGTTVATGSLTKTYGMGGLRLGWALADPALVARARQSLDLADVMAAGPSQLLALAAFRVLPQLAARSRALIGEGPALLRTWVSEDDRLQLSPTVCPFGSLQLPAGVAGERVAEMAAQAGVGVVPGAFFGEADAVRLTGALPEETLHEGLARLRSAIDRAAALP